MQREHGSDGFGNEFRYREAGTGRYTGEVLPIDFAAHARSLGAASYKAANTEELRKRRQRCLRISRKRDPVQLDAVQPADVHIHKQRVFPVRRLGCGRKVGIPRTDADDEIGLMGEPIRREAAGDSNTADVKRMVPRQDAALRYIL